MATRNNADVVDYDNTTSGLAAVTVQAAIDESYGSQLLIANNLSDVAAAATAFANIKQAASETATGVIELATQAEVTAGTDTVRAVTPATLANRLSGFISSSYSAAQTGHWKDNSSGIIIQWGITGNINNDTNAWVNSPSGFDIIFPTNCFMVIGCITSTGATGGPATDPYLAVRKSTTSTFQYRTNALSGTNQIAWIAVGN